MRLHPAAPKSAALTAALAAAATLLVTGPLAGAVPTVDDGTSTAAGSSPDPGPASPDDAVDQVIAISVDALNPKALRRLGPSGAPHLHALIDEGASTLNARTEVERTVTLPNHTGMVTGRRINKSRGGHGVTWNDDRRRPATVQAAAGEDVESVFGVVHDARGTTALFASKTKFSLWERSWGADIDHTLINLRNGALVDALQQDVLDGRRTFRFLHLSMPDDVGHARGFMSPAYLRAVRRVDTLVGEVVGTVDDDPSLAATTAIVLTSDHGGRGSDHSDARRPANYRVPFVVRGPGVDAGGDLYELNRDYADPGRARVSYAGDRQPVRNGDLANLSLDLLDLPSVPDSEHNVAQDLDVTARP
ncbi:MAG: hypothetical protein AVDCRST_MAG32-2765 [uncultured Nocardioides sp.]|uniref:Uncharacterized protein n=1 Tax=uncultured Nocardioides sp. TaxID=198441 RepID=A0A6J4NTX6_9ACTN|nr:MAG: hypothetical protein AVDCRST_MAG32-2765 [uncultured Nocardioides sp.]